jgi:predicted LPLAT superfamily acyltransferase
MSGLRTDPRLANADMLYRELVDLFRDLDEEAAKLVSAKLILLLANHIGDVEVVRAAMAEARKAEPTASGPAPP